MTPSLAVLLIDDDDLSREVIELYLTAAGHHALPAEHGEAALALLGTLPAPPDLLLTDLHMPGPTGPTLLALLRPHLAPDAPAIAMSASQPTPALIQGFTSFLLKPFTPEQLEDTMATAQQLALNPLGAPLVPNPAATAIATGQGEQPLPVLDPTIYGQLSGMLQPDQLRELFQLCFAELDKNLRRLQQAMAAGDREAMRHNAHTIKGSFAVVGARELQQLGATLEAGAGSPADLEASLAEIPLAAKRLQGMLGTRGIHLEHYPSPG